ncbi:ABC-type transport system involved in multi-copper enzyme maturation permease subunit [Caldalkalibacillus uzonensis]|uniref:ABC-type transport system involved in multi-copper enzyme maturation permease subunit n=1 Tax=Caldalkalibacillus uzonensis TaxID=353224 RepID=A0ABU0CV60_9BACI|nr:ABC-type transport system involved in multi-copper enzyme maturation permease subunit [Caldalkalibacillus uzonensis]
MTHLSQVHDPHRWQAWLTWPFWQEQFHILTDGGLAVLIPFHLVAIFIFGQRLVTKEKKERTLDFLLTLPISRRQVVSSKWWFGVLSLTGIYLSFLVLLVILGAGQMMGAAIWLSAPGLYTLYLFTYSTAFLIAVLTHRRWARLLISFKLLTLPVLVVIGLSWWGYSAADLRDYRAEWKWMEAPVLLVCSFILYWLAKSGFKYVSFPASRK